MQNFKVLLPAPLHGSALGSFAVRMEVENAPRNALGRRDPRQLSAEEAQLASEMQRMGGSAQLAALLCQACQCWASAAGLCSSA